MRAAGGQVSVTSEVTYISQSPHTKCHVAPGNVLNRSSSKDSNLWSLLCQQFPSISEKDSRTPSENSFWDRLKTERTTERMTEHISDRIWEQKSEHKTVWEPERKSDRKPEQKSEPQSERKSERKTEWKEEWIVQWEKERRTESANERMMGLTTKTGGKFETDRRTEAERRLEMERKSSMSRRKSNDMCTAATDSVFPSKSSDEGKREISDFFLTENQKRGRPFDCFLERRKKLLGGIDSGYQRNSEPLPRLSKLWRKNGKLDSGGLDKVESFDKEDLSIASNHWNSTPSLRASPALEFSDIFFEKSDSPKSDVSSDFVFTVAPNDFRHGWKVEEAGRTLFPRKSLNEDLKMKTSCKNSTSDQISQNFRSHKDFQDSQEIQNPIRLIRHKSDSMTEIGLSRFFKSSAHSLSRQIYSKNENVDHTHQSFDAAKLNEDFVGKHENFVEKNHNLVKYCAKIPKWGSDLSILTSCDSTSPENPSPKRVKLEKRDSPDYFEKCLPRKGECFDSKTEIELGDVNELRRTPRNPSKYFVTDQILVTKLEPITSEVLDLDLKL